MRLFVRINGADHAAGARWRCVVGLSLYRTGGAQAEQKPKREPLQVDGIEDGGTDPAR